MTDRPLDAIVRDAIEALREVPPADDAVVARVVAAAAQARARDTGPEADDIFAEHEPRGVLRRVGAGRLLLGGAGLAAAAAVAGFLFGSGTRRDADRSSIDAATPAAATPHTIEVTAAGSDVASIPTQFVFESRTAAHVLLIGDFSGWGTHAIPLTREGTSSLWETTVPLPPGRHVYAFLVDSTWTTDPRAPVARDPDFGVTGSVVIVGKP